jgi:hypothetical protein
MVSHFGYRDGKSFRISGAISVFRFEATMSTLLVYYGAAIWFYAIRYTSCCLLPAACCLLPPAYCLLLVGCYSLLFAVGMPEVVVVIVVVVAVVALISHLI